MKSFAISFFFLFFYFNRTGSFLQIIPLKEITHPLLSGVLLSNLTPAGRQISNKGAREQARDL